MKNYFPSDGIQIYYEIFGTGKPIILVHGWGSDLNQSWVESGWVKILKSIRMIIALDCRGHGRSEKPYDQKLYSYNIMAQDIINLMDHLNLVKADIFGYSMGALMAVHLLGHHRERFTSMILGGIGDESEESKDAQFIADALRAKISSQITNPIGHAYRDYVDSNPNNDREALALSALQMWPEGYPIQLGGVDLPNVDIPVIIINGEDDYPYVNSDKTLAKAIPGSQLVRIPNKNHLTAFIDQRFKEVVLEFLKQQC
ncbi:MAG: alpha/beta fold hydrolase [Promethearchaeota archaeon]